MISPGNFRGVVRGKTIERENDPGLKDGQEVAVTLRPMTTRGTDGEGLACRPAHWPVPGSLKTMRFSTKFNVTVRGQPVGNCHNEFSARYQYLLCT